MNYLTTILAATHVKDKFSCGNIFLDDYIKKQAKQDLKAKVAVCFVLIEENKIVKGYYTLSNGSIPRDQLPESFIQKLPKYKDLPVTLLGRLAIDTKYKGQKLGQSLLIDALCRSFEASAASIASMAVIVDPIDAQAIEFYAKFGFIKLPGSARMFLPMATIAALFNAH
jgi:predicted GNAT family N-acyltransferase